METYFEKTPHISDNEKLALITEYNNWHATNKFPVTLLKSYVSEDGRTCLDFAFKENETFSVLCPCTDDDEGSFFVLSGPSLQFWCNALNEFILDSKERVSLTSVLNKGISMYQMKSDSSTHNFSDTESESDNDLPDDGNDEIVDDDMEEDFADSADFHDWRTMCEKKKRWKAKEAQLRAATNQPKTSDMFSGRVKDHPTQIFSNSAASGILTNDLLNIMKTNHETGINADPIDDNIYKWAVYLSNFTPGTDIHSDLGELQQKFQYDFVQLELNFTMDLYPFYPPTLKVIRPRLSSNMMIVIASMDLLKLSYWNPTKPMSDILNEIKNFIQTWVRLDLNCVRNSISLYPEGAYLNIENHLLHLTSVSEIQTRAHNRYPLSERQHATSVPLTARSAHAREKVPRGTGYSSSFHTGWNIDSFLAAQKEKDKQIEVVLNNIYIELKKNRSCTESVMHNSIAPEAGKDEPSVPLCMNGDDHTDCSEMEVDKDSNEDYVGEQKYLYCVLEASSLISFLESRLQADTFLEICKHATVYQYILGIIGELALNPVLVPLLWNLPHQTQSIYTLVKKLESKAEVMLNQLEKVSANGSVSVADNKKNENTPAEENLAHEVCSIATTVTTALAKAGLLTAHDDKPNETGGVAIDPSGSSEPLSEIYVKALKGLQFLDCDIEVDGASAHHFSNFFKGDPPPNSKQVMRLTQDLDALSTSLPIDIGSSIFIRTDDSKMTLFKALIIGPEDTPYSGGCFLFDIYCPPKYPISPPSVHFCTTGMGKIRFNPNLYPCGTVCLSLLGTWKGLQGEQWHKDTSTLLQVLISIQSLIFVPEPYFNEPGFESVFGTDKGRTQSLEYNEEIQIYTIMHAMITQILHPVKAFKDVINLHFRLKKHRILQEIQNSLRQKYSKKLEQQYNNLKSVLDKHYPDKEAGGSSSSSSKSS